MQKGPLTGPQAPHKEGHQNDLSVRGRSEGVNSVDSRGVVTIPAAPEAPKSGFRRDRNHSVKSSATGVALSVSSPV